jgi:hypothetical protein
MSDSPLDWVQVSRLELGLVKERVLEKEREQGSALEKQ